MAYATEADLTAYPVTVPASASAALLLTRASRDVDRALLTAVYDVDAAGDPTDAAVIAALRDATCEQVAGYIDAGDYTGTGAASTPTSFGIGKLVVQRDATDRRAKPGQLYAQAWQVLRDPRLYGKLTWPGPWGQ